MYKEQNKLIKVAIVYHCIAHYREPIFRLLCEQNEGIEYTIIAGTSDYTPSLNTVDTAKSNLPVSQGGLRWRIVKNIWFGNKILWQRGLIKLALSREFDVIIYLGVVYHISTWVSCGLARLVGKKTLMWSHGFLSKEKGLKGWVRSKFYGLCDGMLLYHNRSRDILIERGFDPRKIDVIYNSLDVNKQKKVRETITDEVCVELKEKLFKDPSLPVLLWIGRLTEHKKLNLIIEAVRLLDNEGVNVNLLFVGDGPDRGVLVNETINNRIEDKVVFYGASHNEEELGPIISMADICIAPGEVGLTCMHSLVYGTPVITHDDPDYQMPEYEAIKPGTSGNFFKRGDTLDMVKIIREWLDQNKSRENIRNDCYEVIDAYYNPEFQLKIIDNAVLGKDSTLFQDA